MTSSGVPGAQGDIGACLHPIPSKVNFLRVIAFPKICEHYIICVLPSIFFNYIVERELTLLMKKDSRLLITEATFGFC